MATLKLFLVSTNDSVDKRIEWYNAFCNCTESKKPVVQLSVNKTKIVISLNVKMFGSYIISLIVSYFKTSSFLFSFLPPFFLTCCAILQTSFGGKGPNLRRWHSLHLTVSQLRFSGVFRSFPNSGKHLEICAQPPLSFPCHNLLNFCSLFIYFITMKNILS